MSRRSREDSATAAAHDTAAILARWATPAQVDTLRQVCLAGTIALYVCTALIPSEGVAAQGTGLILVMLWILLGGTWILEGLLRGRLEVRASLTGTAMIALVGWHAVSAFATASQGNARYAANMLWEWIALGTGFLLLRSLVASEKQVRAVVAIMVGLAVLLAIYSFYQHYVTMPAAVARYEANPQAVMQAAGVYAEEGTPQYEHFRNRIRSTEPTATFALTNSLANVLAPWLVVVIGVLLLAWQDTGPNRSALIGMGLCLLPIVFSLLLTQSRTAYIAAALGVAIVWVYGRSQVSRQMWVVPIAAVGLVLLMGLAALVSGGASTELVQSAPKSVLHRLEYWQATMSLVDKYPFFGTGPGNFQDYYAQVQLPQSSETVADPHNFLLEIWATAGSPALLALLAVLGLFAYEATRGAASQEVELDVEDAVRERQELEHLAEQALRRDLGDPLPEPPAALRSTQPAADAEPPEPGVAYIYGGALTGVLLSLPMGFLAGFRSLEELDLGLYAIGLPVAILGVYLLHAWVQHGKLPISVLAAGVIVMLVSLLASGGINFPGVAGSLWILVGLTLYLCERHKPAYVLPPPVAMLGVVLAIGLAILCHQTAYEPVLTARGYVAQGHEALAAGRYDEAEAAFTAAAKADGFSPDPWHYLAGLHLRRWLAAPADLRSPELFQKFVAAKDRSLKLNQHSAETAKAIGQWYLEAYRSSGNEEHLQASIAAYKKAAALFPNSSILHAQLAWVHHLAKDHQSAAAEAAEAVRLDKLNGHEERSLAKQSIVDPGPDALLRSVMLPGPGARTAAKVIDDELYR